jgi:acyl-CoA ligase (AMP-forming) (exosortase A-associated)
MTPPITSHTFLHDLLIESSIRVPNNIAIIDGTSRLDYATIRTQANWVAAALLSSGLNKGARVGIWMEKRFEAVTAIFGCSEAGGVLVPINPLLKTAQVIHILQDCSVSILLTTSSRALLLEEGLSEISRPPLLITVDGDTPWPPMPSAPLIGHRRIDADLACIFYTSGSTGRPKGVMVSHRNLLAGAQSVTSYLKQTATDCLLAALPFSFDAGFSQLSTAFLVGARVVLLNYLFPRDVLTAMEQEGVTGLTAVPPLWIQLAKHEWPAACAATLRYFANTGGRMPRETLTALRQRAPAAKPFLMYGLTEAFRATYLPPEEAERHPDSIGRAIPNAEVMVLREDGSECAADEPGELVQRGALVAMGYWNDAEKTAERFRPLPPRDGSTLAEIAVFSGDTVRRDEEGFLYFIGRRDEMIKTSGYRVSPTEIEEACYATRLVAEVAAIGTEHPLLGQSITVIASAAAGATLSQEVLLAALRPTLPAWMLPSRVVVLEQALPRNPNGKIDRKLLAEQFNAPPTENAS